MKALLCLSCSLRVKKISNFMVTLNRCNEQYVLHCPKGNLMLLSVYNP